MVLSILFLSLLIVPPSQSQAEDRAVAYLVREVPNWSRENHCFSCHNNGDGARALFAAKQAGRAVPLNALSDTTQWVAQPSKWNNEQAGAGFNNKTLAPIQFAASLVEAVDAGLIDDRALVTEAAEALLTLQEGNGSWEVNTGAAAASPVTYGTTLATYMARRTLEKAQDPSFAAAIALANAWLLNAPASNTMNSAAIVLAFAGSNEPRAREKAKAALDTLLLNQGSDGGLGPYANAPSEVFDTAIGLLGMAAAPNRAEIGQQIERGRAFLVSMQLPDGGWQETTRPSGGSSYAQHISTCGWATLALLTTLPR